MTPEPSPAYQSLKDKADALVAEAANDNLSIAFVIVDEFHVMGYAGKPLLLLGGVSHLSHYLCEQINMVLAPIPEAQP